MQRLVCDLSSKVQVLWIFDPKFHVQLYLVCPVTTPYTSPQGRHSNMQKYIFLPNSTLQKVFCGFYTLFAYALLHKLYNLTQTNPNASLLYEASLDKGN